MRELKRWLRIDEGAEIVREARGTSPRSFLAEEVVSRVVDFQKRVECGNQLRPPPALLAKAGLLNLGSISNIVSNLSNPAMFSISLR